MQNNLVPLIPFLVSYCLVYFGFFHGFHGLKKNDNLVCHLINHFMHTLGSFSKIYLIYWYFFYITRKHVFWCPLLTGNWYLDICQISQEFLMDFLGYQANFQRISGGFLADTWQISKYWFFCLGSKFHKLPKLLISSVEAVLYYIHPKQFLSMKNFMEWIRNEQRQPEAYLIFQVPLRNFIEQIGTLCC